MELVEEDSTDRVFWTETARLTLIELKCRDIAQEEEAKKKDGLLDYNKIRKFHSWDALATRIKSELAAKAEATRSPTDRDLHKFFEKLTSVQMRRCFENSLSKYKVRNNNSR